MLVVEDNDDARAALCQLLELGGHRVRAAGDGASGVASALARRPRSCWSTSGCPGIDGYEVARRLRAAACRRILLVAVTGYGLAEDRERALAAGFDVHLVKPVDLSACSRGARGLTGARYSIR